MSGQLQLRRGTTAQNSTFTGAVGELTYNTDDGGLISHDGVTAGGYSGGGYLAAFGGAVRSTKSKLQESISVKDFGAVGNGIVNDTTAIQTALNTCQTLKRNLYFPAGTYLVDLLQLPVTATNQISITGESATNTIIQKRTADSLNLFVIGSASATAYSATLFMRDITFSGIAGNTLASVVAYDLVRSAFTNCIFINSLIGYNSLGGISNTFQTCDFINNTIGINFDKFTSLAGGGYPNNNDLRDCIITDNSLQGINFNNGRSLNIFCCDIENNGTSGNSATGGVLVSNVNSEDGGARPAIGVTISNCWIESNSGDAACQFNSGINTVRSSYFVANSNATYDIHITNGNYHLSEIAFGSNKLNNIKEEAGSLIGNSIVNCFDALVGNFTFNPAKTLLQGLYNSGSGQLADTLQMRSGSAPVVMDMENPMVQTGTAVSGAGGVISVTFSVPYVSSPIVTASVLDNTAGALNGVQIYNTTVAGFTVRINQVVSGSSTVNPLVGYDVNWTATGPTV